MQPIVTYGVAWSVGLSVVGQSVTIVSPAKTAEPIEILFEYCGLGLVQRLSLIHI